MQAHELDGLKQDVSAIKTMLQVLVQLQASLRSARCPSLPWACSACLPSAASSGANSTSSRTNGSCLRSASSGQQHLPPVSRP